MRRLEISFLLSFVFCTLLTLVGFEERCSGIRDEVFRLHVIANSDSAKDQELKLKVRDRLLDETNELFINAETKEEAIKISQENIGFLQSVAEDELSQNNCDMDVKINIGESYFNTRVYDNDTLPAGVYQALKVEIGEGKGKNWWCVMFPQMCLPAAEEKTQLNDVLEESEMEIVENGEKYEIRFKCIEWYEGLINWMHSI